MLLCLAMLIAFSQYDTAMSWECRLILINDGPGASVGQISLEPATAWIEKGTCVVWVNRARTSAPELIIKFRENQKCEEVTEAASGFKNVEGCYVTGALPPGGTSSLRFNQAGTYTYQVQSGESMKAEGKIVVQ